MLHATSSRSPRTPSLLLGFSLLGLLLILALPQTSNAATITVTSGGDAGGTCPGVDCTLRQAIAAAAPGDTINFAVGISTVTLTSAELLINKNLTINGPGANLLTVQRSSAPVDLRILNVTPASVTATISGLTIANGNTFAPGAGISNAGTLTITNSTISGNISASSGGGVYNIGSLTLNNSTISGNASLPNGGGIYNDSGMLTITNSTISGNSAPGGSGGGIFRAGGTLTITNSTISGNSGAAGGGIYNSGSGMATITNSTISGNSAQGNGGGILHISGSATITNSTITGNSASAGGGGIWFQVNVTSRNTIVALNTASTGPDLRIDSGTFISQGFNLIGNNSGGGIITPTTGDQIGTAASPINPMLGPLQDNGGPTFTHALLSGSTAIEGGNSFGANTDQRGFARPVDSPVIGNVGDGSDIGAYEVQADLLPGCSNINRIVNNNNDTGTDSLRSVIANVCAGSIITFTPNVIGAINLTSGELLINKTLTINGPGANLLSVQRSVGAGNFRIIRIAPATVIANISGMTIANGNAPGDDGGNGGGISSLGRLTLVNATVSGNTANNGCGILNSSGNLTLINSTISGNSATFAGNGGGIWNFAGTLTVINSTISGNLAGDPNFFPLGGGIYNSSGGTVILTNSTISGNTAALGGGILNGGGSTLRSRNSIIALNTAGGGPDVNGALISENFNLIGNNSGATITPAQFQDQIGTAGSPINPLLGPLQNNGGTTFTLALLNGSTAIDRGHSSGSTTDQRGSTRPSDDPGITNASGGDGSDIGAFELQGPVGTPTNTSTPTNTPTSTATNSATATATATPGGASISGTITYGNAIGTPVPPRFVKNVSLSSTLGSPSVGPVITGTPGTYTLTGFGAGSYTIKPTKPAGPNAAISSFDAARVAQGVVGSPSFVSQNQRFAADVTGNGLVSSQDAGKIAQFAAGLPIQPPNLTSEWRFFVTGAPSPLPTPPQTYDDSRTYASVTSSLTGEDYVAILMGDVTGNWNPATHPRPAGKVNSEQWTVDSEDGGPERGIEVKLPDVVTPVDKEIVVPVNVQGVAEKGVISYEFDLRYDPSVIQPLANPVDVTGTISRGLSVVVNPYEPGLLRVVVYGPMPIDSDGVLLNLKFTAVGVPGWVSPLVWERVMFNEGESRVSVTDGRVEIN